MPAFDARLTKLRDLLTSAYDRAWGEVRLEQERVAEGLATNPRLWRQEARLAEVRARIEETMDSTDAFAREWLGREYPKFYAAGAQLAAETLNSPFAWTQAHLDAIAAHAQDTYDDLLAATAHVTEDTKRFLREISREASLRGTIIGRTPAQLAKAIRTKAAERGITSVVYKDGSRHGLAEYADVVARTKTAVAYNAGSLNQGQALGVKFYEVFDGPVCGWAGHGDPELANGKIVSASQAAAHIISHPRCARSFGARPDVTTARAAAKAEPSEGGQPEYRTAAARAQRIRARERAGMKLGADGSPPGYVLEQRATMLQNRTLSRAARGVSAPPRVPRGPRAGGPPGGQLGAGEDPFSDEAAEARRAGMRPRDAELDRLFEGMTAEERAFVESLDVNQRLRAARLLVRENPAELTGGQYRRQWWDELPKETGLDAPVPVRDYLIESSSEGDYRIAEGVAYRVDGRVYVVESPTPGASVQAQHLRARPMVEDAHRVYQTEVPAEMHHHQKGVAFMTGANPGDAYWARVRGVSGFQSAATGGDGATYVWGTRGRQVSSGTLRHEFGHNLDFGNGRGHWSAFSKRAEWSDAMDGDFRLNDVGETQTGYVNATESGHRLTPSSPKGLTTYGQQDIVEDFAESVRLYLLDRRDGYMATTLQARRLRFADLFPRRARLLDGYFAAG